QLQTELNFSVSKSNQEPFKTYIYLIGRKLPFRENDGGGIELYDTSVTYKNSDETEQDLQILKNALITMGARTLAVHDVQKVIRHLKVFGFHLAHLDIRQNSQHYESALMDIVKTSMPDKYSMIS